MGQTEAIVHLLIQHHKVSACRHLQLSTLAVQCTWFTSIHRH